METLFYRNDSFCYFFCLYEKPSDVKCIVFSNVFVNKSNIYKWSLTKTNSEIKEIMKKNCSLEEDEKGYFVNFKYEGEKYFSLSNFCETGCHKDGRKTNHCPAKFFKTLQQVIEGFDFTKDIKRELEKEYKYYFNFLTYYVDFVIPIEQPKYRSEESCIQKNKKDFISILNEDDVKSQMSKLKEDIILSQLTS